MSVACLLLLRWWVVLSKEKLQLDTSKLRRGVTCLRRSTCTEQQRGNSEPTQKQAKKKGGEHSDYQNSETLQDKRHRTKGKLATTHPSYKSFPCLMSLPRKVVKYRGPSLDRFSSFLTRTTSCTLPTTVSLRMWRSLCPRSRTTGFHQRARFFACFGFIFVVQPRNAQRVG